MSKMKPRKLNTILFTLFLSLTASVVTGCNNGGGGGSGGSGEEEGGTINFWAYQPSKQTDQTAYKNLISEFSAETGIKVKLLMVVKDSYNKSLNGALTSRSKPDIAYLDQPRISDYAHDGTIMKLDDEIAGNPNIDNSKFFASGLATTMYKGGQYGVPLNMTTSVLFYNKDIVSTPPTSWEEWLNTPVSGSEQSLFDGIGTGGYAGWYYQVFLANNGGKLLNDAGNAVAFNDAKGVEAAQMIQDLYTFDNPQGSINRSANNAFGRGQIAYKLGSSSDIDALDTNYPNLNYGVSLIPPKVKGDTSYSNMGGENLVIFNHSPRKANCIKLIEFLLREENINKIASFTGNFPAIEEYATIESIPVIKEESRARKAVILEQLQNSVPRPVVPKWIEVNDQYLGVAISDKVLSEDPARRDIQAALNEAAQAANMKLFGS